MCDEGSFWNKNSNSCVKCDASCSTCSDGVSCDTCANDFSKIKNVVSKCYKCEPDQKLTAEGCRECSVDTIDDSECVNTKINQLVLTRVPDERTDYSLLLLIVSLLILLVLLILLCCFVCKSCYLCKNMKPNTQSEEKEKKEIGTQAEDES